MPRHPAAFSDNIILILIGLLDGCETVLDPFGGTGKLAVIKKLGFTGKVYCCEIEPEWAESSLYPVDEWYIGDAASMPWPDGYFDAVCTSPTYGNRMADHFDARDGSHRITYRHYLGRPLDPRNTGRMQWGDSYRNKHTEVYRECLRVLKDGGIFVLNISDHIRGGVVMPVTDWHKNTLTKLGMQLIDELKVETPRMRFAEHSHLRVEHESILVFKK